jgi:enamine deaminase RidA (YjgF/YER057c/UK114 family)
VTTTWTRVRKRPAPARSTCWPNCRRPAGDLDNIERVIKLTVFVASEPEFTQQPQVADAASRLIIDVLGAAGAHARSAIGVAALPLDTPVEIEAIAAVRTS